MLYVGIIIIMPYIVNVNVCIFICGDFFFLSEKCTAIIVCNNKIKLVC